MRKADGPATIGDAEDAPHVDPPRAWMEAHLDEMGDIAGAGAARALRACYGEVAGPEQLEGGVVLLLRMAKCRRPASVS